MKTFEDIKAFFDHDSIRSQIVESAKIASGVRFPTEHDTDNTLKLIELAWKDFDGKPIAEGELVKCDGLYRRICHVCSRNDDGSITVQFAESGSFYLCPGHGSFSGSLDYPETIDISPDPIGWKDANYWIF